jgi:hypothetical protein
MAQSRSVLPCAKVRYNEYEFIFVHLLSEVRL